MAEHDFSLYLGPYTYNTITVNTRNEKKFYPKYIKSMIITVR